MLGSIFGPDGLHGRSVLDLFAGSGALGIEALSRGAAHATFVEQDPRALSIIRANLTSVGIDQARTALWRAEVGAWLTSPGGRASFDVVFCDPPYASDSWGPLWGALEASVVVAESRAELDVPAPWRVHRRKHYGSTLVTVVRGDAAVPGGAARGAWSVGRQATGGSVERAIADMAATTAGIERGVR